MLMAMYTNHIPGCVSKGEVSTVWEVVIPLYLALVGLYLEYCVKFGPMSLQQSLIKWNKSGRGANETFGGWLEHVTVKRDWSLLGEGGLEGGCRKRSIFIKLGSIWNVNPARYFPMPGPGTAGLGLCPKGLLHPSGPRLVGHMEPYRPGKPEGW